MSEIKNGGLDQYGAEHFEQQQFGTAGVEGVNTRSGSAMAERPRELSDFKGLSHPEANF